MTLTVSMKSTAAGFDHLGNTGHIKYAAGQQPDSTKQDGDPSPKLRTRMQTLESKGVILHEVTNMNNNNKTTELNSIRRHVLNQGEVVDDAAHTLYKVPVPMAWSPGMTFKSNPLLMITPQKPPSSANENFLSTKENILEPQSANKIPKPTAWSPGMKIQPDPNLFVTPEKAVSKKIIANDRQTTDTVSSNIQNIPAKVKNSYSVRFDLPSSTSEDESKDPLSETDSPITIRGRDLDVQGQSFESPEGKSFSFQKTYNPGIYSDDSSLDGSILNSLSNCSFDQSYKKQASLGVTKSVCDNSYVQASVSSVLPNCTSDKKKSIGSVAEPCKSTEADKNIPKTGNKDAQLSVSSTWPHRVNPKLNSAKNTRSKGPHDRKKLPVGDKFIAKADHVNSQLSTESAPEGFMVIREMQNHQQSTKYSFPFELTTTADDCEYEHVFARPEFNSTLAIREQLDNLQDQEVNVMKAVQDTLAKSEVKRSELNEKAAVYTNRMSGQFKNLVDLNTSVESLCDRIVRMRTSKVPGKRRATHTEKKFSESQRAPDLMEFFASDLQKEYPDVTLPNVTAVTSQLMTSPPETSFDLYRHNRLWQGISDF